MNDEFLRDCARAIRSLADKADPFIKKRLLDLAEKYERSIGRPPRPVRSLANQFAEDQAGQASEIPDPAGSAISTNRFPCPTAGRW
jgi:hypothetical protein